MTQRRSEVRIQENHRQDQDEPTDQLLKQIDEGGVILSEDRTTVVKLREAAYQP